MIRRVTRGRVPFRVRPFALSTPSEVVLTWHSLLGEEQLQGGEMPITGASIFQSVLTLLTAMCRSMLCMSAVTNSMSVMGIRQAA